MYKNLITAIALGSGALLWAAGASAVTTISIGDCLGAACSPSTIATGSGSVAIGGSMIGSWIVTASAMGSPPLAATTLDFQHDHRSNRQRRYPDGRDNSAGQ